MRMVTLRCDCSVMPDDISEVTVNTGSNTITVRMKNGVGHSIQAAYQKGIYETKDKLVAEINEALK